MNDAEWMVGRTEGAPEALRARTMEFFTASPGPDLPGRLAHAAQAALSGAIAATSREGALDLLAADALITLALLAAAERSPADLAAQARALRLLAA